MNKRRDFIKALAVTTGAMGLSAAGVRGGAATVSKNGALPVDPYWDYDRNDCAAIRAYWCDVASRLAAPVLEALSKRKLRALMPVEARHPERNAAVTHLEAFGRLLNGIAPWLQARADNSPEGRARARFADLACESLDAASDPKSPDCMNFSGAKARQPLVDSAFLAQALLRAPDALWKRLDARAQSNLLAGLKASRSIMPNANNWQLFASMVEVALHRFGEKRDEARLFNGLRNFRQWYAGDGWYGDGATFHTDYYNSFVIQPMLVEMLDAIGDEADEWREFRTLANARLTRYAAVQERLIAPDGSYPAIGRSIAYRCGAFQGLALAALRGQLPREITPGQARTALTCVIRRTMEAPGTFDGNGWLRIGLSGHQPALGEAYISTGSLYLCSFALIPLGLPSGTPFWKAAAAPLTWEKAWGGISMPADHALNDKNKQT